MANGNTSTNRLLQQLFKTTNLKRFLRQNNGYLQEKSISEYLSDLCSERGVIREQVIKRARIDREFGHQLFNGRRKPSRDKLIQLAFGFSLNYEETQDLLKAARMMALYPRVKRDAVIIYGLKNEFGVEDVDLTLDELGLEILSGVKANV